MYNKDPWKNFEAVYCLSLEGDIERQRHASAELCRVGLNGFKFVDGVKADSDEVRDAYKTGLICGFPPCFRCGQITCGSSECNNIIIEPQVGCFLSFMKIFRLAAASKENTFLLVEDDIKFHDYALDLADVAFRASALHDLGIFSQDPCLIGLGRGLGANESCVFDGLFTFIEGRKLPQNPCFAFNRAFAQLALRQFRGVNHTSDVYIHFELSEQSRHYSLEPPLSYELSTSTGALPSRIHPKEIAIQNDDNPPAVRAAAQAALDRHLKHVKVVGLVITGNARGGTGFMARAMSEYGLDVGHETLGLDGISSWMFAVPDVDLPFGAAGYARNSKYVFADKTIAVVRASPQAVFATLIENSKNIQSYAFRRRWIKILFDIDLDAFPVDFDRALAAYTFWYKAIALRKPMAWVRLEHAAYDIDALFSSGFLTSRKEPNRSVLTSVVNSKKPYFDQIYHYQDDFRSRLTCADSFVRKEYYDLKNELSSLFYLHG